MPTSDFNTWRDTLLAKESELSSHFAAFPSSPCDTGQQLSAAFAAWKASHQTKVADVQSHGQSMPSIVCEVPPPAGGPFFSGNSYTLAASAALPAQDLSGLAVHTTTGNVWALNETPGKLFELTRDGVILRTVNLTSANPFDLEGLAHVGGDAFAVFDTLLGSRKLIKFTVPAGATSVDLDAGQSTATIKTWESLAYEPAADTFHLWADRDYSRFVPNGSGGYVEQFVFDPKYGPPGYGPAPRTCESLDFNAAASQHLFHWSQIGVCKETNKDTGVVVSQFNFATFPGWLAGKWEGMSVEAGTKSVYLVRESSVGQINFQRWDRV